MDVVEQLQDDLREGRIAPLRLIELLLAAQRQLQEAHQRIAELEKQLAGSPSPKVDQPFSLRSEEKRQDVFHRFRRLFERYDILLTPAAPVKPFPVEMNFPLAHPLTVARDAHADAVIESVLFRPSWLQHIRTKLLGLAPAGARRRT